jgi:hypothetical protein
LKACLVGISSARLVLSSITNPELCHPTLKGGLAEEEVENIIGSLIARGQLHLTFLEFLDYVPLFNRIHSQIVAAPLEKGGELLGSGGRASS